jgi:acyl carrier protein
MSEQVLTRVCEIAGDVLESPVTADSSPATVETWDSVRHLNLILALEEEYGLQFRPEDTDEAKSIRDLVQLVAARRS